MPLDIAPLSALERLEIREACERLALDYSFLADGQRMDEFSELFAEDGELVLFGQTHRGPPASAPPSAPGAAEVRFPCMPSPTTASTSSAPTRRPPRSTSPSMPASGRTAARRRPSDRADDGRDLSRCVPKDGGGLEVRPPRVRTADRPGAGLSPSGEPDTDAARDAAEEERDG